jgi:hypothetical protein
MHCKFCASAGDLLRSILRNIHQESWSKIEAVGNLQYLLAEVSPDTQFGFTGPFPALQYAVHLRYANLSNHQLLGTLNFSPAMWKSSKYWNKPQLGEEWGSSQRLQFKRQV